MIIFPGFRVFYSRTPSSNLLVNMSTVEVTRYSMPKQVARKVAGLRWLIRLYTLVEGLAAMVLLLGTAFWIGLAVDWLLEPSVAVRVVLWGFVAIAAIFVAVHYIFRRVFARLDKGSIALAMERQFPQLRESLVTTVEASEQSSRLAGLRQSDRFHPAMLQETSRLATEGIAGTSMLQVLRIGPLLWKSVAAVLLVMSIAAFAMASHENFSFWLERMRLNEQLWPRRVALRLVGFEEVDGKRVVSVAHDDDYKLQVDASIIDGHTAPDSVEIRYRLADGRRGRDTMTKVGEALPGRDEFQLYQYLFKHVVSDLDFEIVGGDDRIRDLQLRTVGRPQILRMFVDLKYPAYLDRAPRTTEISDRLELPEGATATCHVRANKPLQQVRIQSASAPSDLSPDVDADDDRQFHFSLPEVMEDRVLLLTMRDLDGIENREPYRLLVSVVHDEVPEVSVQLRGIGTAVTPQATIPFSGQVTDEYGLRRVWFEYQVDQQPPEQRNMLQDPEGNLEFDAFDRFDLAESDPETTRPRIELKPGQKFTISIRASDAYNLAQAEHVGESQRFLLDVVTPSELHAILEKRELGLRQRFEAIYEKMAASRDLLDRIGGVTPPAAPEEADEQSSDDLAEEDARNRQRDRLRVSSVLQNVTQMSYETLGVADRFDRIVEELINNRIETEELERRLSEEIAAPLRTIGNEQMPELERQLQSVQRSIGESDALEPPLLAARKQADLVLLTMKQVLDRMLELESYNELVTLLREIVTEQKQLGEETKKRQRDQLRDLLDDL